jgi:hypothetical protein
MEDQAFVFAVVLYRRVPSYPPPPPPGHPVEANSYRRRYFYSARLYSLAGYKGFSYPFLSRFLVPVVLKFVALLNIEKKYIEKIKEGAPVAWGGGG